MIIFYHNSPAAAMLINYETLLLLLLLLQLLLVFVKVVNNAVQLFYQNLWLSDVSILLILEVLKHFIHLFLVVWLFFNEFEFLFVVPRHLLFPVFVPFNLIIVVQVDGL